MTMLLKGPHPNGAKLLINYLMSPEGGKVMREANYIPANAEIEAKDPTLKPEVGKFRVITPTPEDIEQNVGKWIGIYKELFQ